MGLKFRLGLAVGGLLMSSMFGTNMLFGIKDYVDTTGNIMVDIADGIGMISTGIEALEHWIDPTGHPLKEDKIEPKEGVSPAVPPVPNESPLPADVPKPATVDSPGTLPADQPTVFCQKGKCYPYDPAKQKKANIELEATPGMILTKPTPTKKPVQKQQPQKGRRSNNQEDEDDDERPRKKATGAGRPPIVLASSTTSTTPSILSSPTPLTTPSTLSSSTSSSSTSESTSSPETASDASDEDLKSSRPVLYGTKKILRAFGGVLQRTSKVLLKLVNRMFPWNRRARRRLSGEEDE